MLQEDTAAVALRDNYDNRSRLSVCVFVLFFSSFFFRSLLLTRLSQHTLWLNEEQKRGEDLDSLEEDTFWDSPSRRRYYALSGARISKLSEESRKIYQFDSDGVDDDAENSGDDYIGS